MCLPFLNLFVWYDALLPGWCVAYVGDASASFEAVRNDMETKRDAKVKITRFVRCKCLLTFNTSSVF
jgi:hypothetical protein